MVNFVAEYLLKRDQYPGRIAVPQGFVVIVIVILIDCPGKDYDYDYDYDYEVFSRLPGL